MSWLHQLLLSRFPIKDMECKQLTDLMCAQKAVCHKSSAHDTVVSVQSECVTSQPHIFGNEQFDVVYYNINELEKC